MRLGIDGRELSVGVRTGIGRYLASVVRGAAQQGVDCIVYSDRELPKLEAVQGATVRIIPRRPTVWWDQVSLPRQMAQGRISVFLSPYYKCPLRSPCPVVLTIHDLLFIEYLGRPRPVYDRVMTRMARLYASRSVAIIARDDRGYIGQLPPALRGLLKTLEYHPVATTMRDGQNGSPFHAFAWSVAGTDGILSKRHD